MKEIKAIIEAYCNNNFEKNKAALVTVVGLEGSSYRRKGARMLVFDTGDYVGGISGGCLEGDALKRARIAINKDKPSIIRYDTTQNDEHQIGVGLGCNGIIDVLFIPLDPSNKNNPLELLSEIKSSRDLNVLITINNGDCAGWTFLYKDASTFIDSFPVPEIANEAVEAIENCLLAKTSTTQNFNNTSVFIELIVPAIHLYIFGSNNDIYPIGRIANELGWEITMITKRNKLRLNELNFKCEIIDINNQYDIKGDNFTAIVLMSHDYNTDLSNLSKLLKVKYFYFGILGPRKRGDKLFNELGEAYSHLPHEVKDKIFSPIGLDIGAATPEEIALSVIAEIKANFANRNGGFLKLREGTIYGGN
ncbi:MAG: XdhC/CoxI family protein [Ginsengibacter sp.]